MRVGGSWRYVVFGVAIVVMMALRPQGIVTRAMVDRISPWRWASRRVRSGGVAWPRKPALALNGVSKHFGGVTVADGITFEVPSGARMALIGPNGAGKTTLFNLISGVYPLDDGTHPARRRADRRSCRRGLRVRAGLARSFQNIRLMPHLSVIENVMLGQHVLASGVGELLRPLSLAAPQPVARDLRAKACATPASTSIPTRMCPGSAYGVAQEDRGGARADEPAAAADAGRAGGRA